jgi:hypothetical protein
LRLYLSSSPRIHLKHTLTWYFPSDSGQTSREYVDEEVKARVETDFEIEKLEMDLETIYEEIHTTFQQHGIIDEDDDSGYAKYKRKKYTDLMNANNNIEGIQNLAEKLQEHLKFRKICRRDIPIALRKKIKEKLTKTHKEGLKTDLKTSLEFGTSHQHHGLSDLEVEAQMSFRKKLTKRQVTAWLPELTANRSSGMTSTRAW